jgi:hypothetical protein
MRPSENIAGFLSCREMGGEIGVRSALDSFRDDNESRADLTPNLLI